MTAAGSPKLSMFIDTNVIGPPTGSIALLSGDQWRLGPDDIRTNVTITVEAAWHCPIQDLTCEHFRMLVSQQMGMRWISMAVAEFVTLHPKAEVTNYPGEVALLALKALPKIEASNPLAAERLRALDYGWMEDEFSFSRPLQREARAILAQIAR